MRTLITGASGFLGTAIINSNNSHEFIGVYRETSNSKANRSAMVSEINEFTDWSELLIGVNVIVHCAARVHIMDDASKMPLTEFRSVNRFGTINLAIQAAASGVKRFIFISSIKVNGESTSFGNKFSPDDVYIPTDPYGLSKYEAEQGLKEIAKQTGMEVVIIRPPLIYGPYVKANFRSMMKWVNRGVPLPFGSISNLRSFVSLTNLVDFISVCVKHPNAANETFLISDGEDISTTELLNRIGIAFNKKAKLIPVPVVLMKLAAKMIGKKNIADRIFGNLQLDSSKASTLLDWKPKVTMEEELKMTVKAYLNE